jgi:galactose mutarotase-like enzyme
MEKVEISSEFISASISLDGAEMKSLHDKDSKIEYIWNGDEKHWGRSAPILFPIVGRLKDEFYRIDRKFYSLTQHGFARDMKFSLVSKETDFVKMRLEANKETLQDYPFKFTLDVSYRVYGPKITVNYDVYNNDKKDMLFSIGAHPAFSIPFQEGNIDDYYIEFEVEEKQGAFGLERGLVNFHEKDNKKIFEGKRLPLTYELFEEDALIFKDHVSTKVTLKNTNDDHSVCLEYGHVPYLGLWTKKDAPFICIEPWHGVADSVDSNNNFLEKEGLITLDPGAHFNMEYSITLR